MHRITKFAGLTVVASLLLGATALTPAITHARTAAKPSLAGSCQLGKLTPALKASPEARGAKKLVNTARFKFKANRPIRLGVSAGYLSNSWVVFALHLIKWEASKFKQFSRNIRVTDAGFNANKQVSDIHDLINAHVDAIIYWPVDDKAIEPALEAAVRKGIPTVNVGGGYLNAPGVITNAYIDQYVLGRMVAQHLMTDMHGSGQILSLIPIAGTTAAVDQTRALHDVLSVCPGVKLLDTENGDWNRAKSQTIAQNWTQRFPQATGIFSPAGQMSAGAATAYLQAGMLDKVVFSPGDEYNGWLKFEIQHPSQNHGVVTFPPEAGAVGVDAMVKILNGQSIHRGIRVPSVYIPPNQVRKHAQMNRPDDWWSTKLPAKWLP